MKVSMSVKRCPICGKEFVRRGNRKNSCRIVCCSVTCKSKAQKGRIIPGFNQKPKLGKIQTCKTCGSEFQRAPSRSGKYCSQSCRAHDKASFEAIRGSRHYNWKGGKTPTDVTLRRSPEARAWTMAVFRRDKFRCRVVGCEERRLQAHHIAPWADFPHLRFDVSNGVTLCKAHHGFLHWYFRHVRKNMEKKMDQWNELFL